MKTYHKRRLLRLADYLEVNVSMADYEHDSWPNCAAGWACEIPEFNQRGLWMAQRKNANGTFSCLYPVYSKDGVWIPSYEGLAHFFGLVLEEAHWLFDHNYYDDLEHTNKEEVSKRIRRVVEESNSSRYLLSLEV